MGRTHGEIYCRRLCDVDVDTLEACRADVNVEGEEVRGAEGFEELGQERVHGVLPSTESSIEGSHSLIGVIVQYEVALSWFICYGCWAPLSSFILVYDPVHLYTKAGPSIFACAPRDRL